MIVDGDVVSYWQVVVVVLEETRSSAVVEAIDRDSYSSNIWELRPELI